VSRDADVKSNFRPASQKRKVEMNIPPEVKQIQNDFVERCVSRTLEQACASIASATPNRKGRSMNRRYGQSGYAVKKGNMWHGRYYVDLQERRKRVSVPIGPVDQFTKPEAKRKLRDLLEQSGVNTEAHLLKAMNVGRTFEQESSWWRQNKLSLFKPSCQETMGSHIDRYLLPCFGQLSTDAVDERRVQEFVADLNRTELAPKSIRNIVGIWSSRKFLKRNKGTLPRMRCGKSSIPSRDSDARSLQPWQGQVFAAARYSGCTSKIWSCRRAVSMFVAAYGAGRKSRSRQRGNRTVNIEPALAEMLRQHLAGRKSGRVFQTQNGTPFSKDNVRRKLVSVLDRLGLKRGGLHAFRHGRVSVLQENGVPGDLVKEWIGHSSLRTTSRYTHMRPEFRERVAAEVGLFRSMLDPIGPSLKESNAA
jgi:Phage integrase family